MLEQQQRVLGRQALETQAAHLARQAPLPRRHDEAGARRDVEHLLEFLLTQEDIVKQDQRLFFQQIPADFRFGGFAEPVALVESLEDQLKQVGGTLVPRLQVNDTVGIGTSRRVVGQVAEERRLADARLAADLDVQPSGERRERRVQLGPAPQQVPDGPRANQNGRVPGVDVPLDRTHLANHGAPRLANLQDISPYRQLPGNRAEHGRFLRRGIHGAADVVIRVVEA